MRRLRSSSACLYANHAGRCYGGATLAYPIPVRHPKFHHGGGIGSSLCGSFSTIDPARYGIDWPRSSLWAGKETLRDENRVVSRSHLAVTKILISMPPSSERLQPKPHPPSNKSFTLVAEVTTLRCIVHHQVGGCQRKSVHCFKISFSLESLLGRRQLNHVDRSPSYFHCFPKNEIPRKYAESFTDVLLRQKSDKINGENVQ